MLAIKIKDVKLFMAKLLSADTFDTFLLEEAQIHTFNTFTIDGHQNREFYTKEELEDPEIFPYEYSCWKEIKGICFILIFASLQCLEPGLQRLRGISVYNNIGILQS